MSSICFVAVDTPADPLLNSAEVTLLSQPGKQLKANLSGVLCFPMSNNASSMTVLDSGRATHLPFIPGRAIWKCGSVLVEVQTPFLDYAEAEQCLSSSAAPRILANEPRFPKLAALPA